MRGARHVVDVKRLLDDLCGPSRSSWIVEQLCPGLFNAAQSALDGDAFLAAVVPFVEEEAAEVPALVPVSAMIGESWKWHECTSSWRSADELEVYLTAPERAFRSDPDASLSTYVEALGLAVAFEGKNRVRFLRDRGVEHVPSAVAIAGYPAAERLKIVHVQTGRGKRAWCVLDDRWLEPLILPAVSHAILDPYGVRTLHRWPSDWPKAGAVEKALERAAGGRPHQPVDLRQLLDRQAELESQDEWIHTSAIGLDVYRLRWRPVLMGVTGVLLATFASAVLPAPYAGPLSWGLSGAAVGFAVAWCAPLLRARRRHVA
ncbi:hypothetical protein ABQY09_02690 [Xanthomonas hortorum pv. hederae]